MQKFAIYSIVAIVFAVAGFSFAKFCPIGIKFGPAQAKAQDQAPTAASDPEATARAQLASSAMSTVFTLRSQVALYRLQHNDEYPNFKKYAWKQLTFKTNTAGQITEYERGGNQLYGPYLQLAPTNPLTKSSEILVVSTLPENFKATGSYGFVFEESTGKLFALAADGKVFDDSSASVR